MNNIDNMSVVAVVELPKFYVAVVVLLDCSLWYRCFKDLR